MARQCAVTAKKPLSGHKVSHSNIKTKRRWLPNLQVVSLPSELLGRPVRLRLSSHGIRSIEHRGGLDAYLLKAKPADLPPATRVIQKRVQKLAAKAAGGKLPKPTPRARRAAKPAA